MLGYFKTAFIFLFSFFFLGGGTGGRGEGDVRNGEMLRRGPIKSQHELPDIEEIYQ